MSSAQVATRSRLRFTPRAAILIAILVGMLLYMVVPLRIYLGQRAQVRQLQQQTRTLEQQNAALATQVKELKDPKYLERVARECLGMVRPGEIGFIVVPAGGHARPHNC